MAFVLVAGLGYGLALSWEAKGKDAVVSFLTDRYGLKEPQQPKPIVEPEIPNVQSLSNFIEPEMVRLPSGISMGKYEVTQGQWKAVMGDNPAKFNGCGDDCPVEWISWDDVQLFIEKLNAKTGKRYRLPTKNEWFKACQAGNNKTEYCGSNNADSVAWYEDNSDYKTHSVGQKQANAWGLYDMSGNVWEWMQDCYEADCSRRVLRGGSWYTRLAFLRSAWRDWYYPVWRNFDVGFRLAQD